MQRRLAAAVVAALALSGPAAAHVTPQPSFLVAGGTATLSLSGPNERDRPLTGFAVTVPRGLRVVRAQPAPGWDASVEGRTASWTGGSVGPNVEATFELEVEARSEPGAAEVLARQLYADGREVEWRVALTVVPGSSPSQNLGPALAVGLLGLVALGCLVGGVWWGARRSSLQER